MDTITLKAAHALNVKWENDGMPHDGLRIVGYYVAGNGMRSFLEVPGNDNAPCYEYKCAGWGTMEYYEHVAGPTLGQWQAEQDAADLRDTQRMAV